MTEGSKALIKALEWVVEIDPSAILASVNGGLEHRNLTIIV